MRSVLIFLFLLLTTIVSAQKKETCYNTSTNVDDLYDISKCKVTTSNKTNSKGDRLLAVKISANNSTRFRKKRSNQNIVSKSKPFVEKTKILSLVKPLTTINSTKKIEKIANQDKIVKVEDLNTKNITKVGEKIVVNKKQIINFSEATIIPLFKECESKTSDKNLACFNKQMKKHIKKYFNYPHSAISQKIQGDVWVKFVIDKDGNVKNIKARGPKNTEILEREAFNVAYHLPKFKPGKLEDEDIDVSYVLPITFSIDH